MLTALLLLAALPAEIHLKTPQQSFSSENAYLLSEGRLWVKSRPDGRWGLFEGSGLPFGKHAPSFRPEDRLVSFGTEGLMVVALSNRGRFYLWQPTLFTPTTWEETAGSPFPGELRLPESRDWAFSMSVQVAPKKRRTPMKDIDAYYEDAVGNRVEFGFTATVYVLDPDGQRIRYWDTGLPPAFYKAFNTPERGRFVAERLSASGSTLFVVDRAGRMFTRMMDYEMNGACPGLRYTFEPRHQSKGEQILSLFEAERVLPLAGWRAQEPIPLQGQAEQTTQISIHLTGKGNAARQLRVQGRDAAGRWGYWWKAIFDGTWNFEETQQAYPPQLAVQSGAPHPVGRMLDKTYRGTLRQVGQKDLAVELVDFDYFDTPATLRVHRGGRSWDLTLHTFDAWGPSTEQKEHPALVGSPLGEPKLLLGTLEIPEPLLNSGDPEIRALLDTTFRRLHRVHLAFSIAADDARVLLTTRTLQREGLGRTDYAVRNPLRIEVTRPLSPEELGVYQEIDFTHLTSAPALLLPAGETDPARIADALRRNQALLAKVEQQQWKQTREHLGAGVVAAVASSLFIPVNGLSDALDLPRHLPAAGGIALTGGDLLTQYASMNLKHVISHPGDAREAAAILKQRIRDYQGRQRQTRPHL